MTTEAATTLEIALVKARPLPVWLKSALGVALLALVALMGWVFLTSGGNPDPTARQDGSLAAILDIGVLVFREGLECILVLAAITASMVGKNEGGRRMVGVGAGVGAFVTVITWFIAINVVHDLSTNLDALQVQAWTGLLAVVVLLIVMNWFFHKLYWGGWIAMHNKKKKELLAGEQKHEVNAARVAWGLGLLGFASFYREGVEVVLFLQSYYLRLGAQTVYLGALVGVFFAGIVAILTFIAHHKLPYRRMLELTGIMLGGVLLIMVGEQAQEMQLARWIPTTEISWLSWMPDWLGLWFSVFPTVETLAAQAIAAALVIGSFFLAKKQSES